MFGKDIASQLSCEKVSQIEEFYRTDFSNVRFRLGGLIPKVVPWDYAAIVFNNTINYNKG
ncbi:MAG: hypothetical protein SVY10_14020 [Thermodesulfobacteriota bacterium]|nr:hypothetical protein [Thermodesulfobacteriota bacterium]